MSRLDRYFEPLCKHRRVADGGAAGMAGWLIDTYLSCTRDVYVLGGMKEEIVARDKMKTRLVF